MTNILVSIDFHEETDKLIEEAIKYAQAFDSKVWLIHVAAPDPDFVGYEAGPQYLRDHRAEELRKEHRMVQDYANKIKDQGLEADGLLIAGATIEMILEEARQLDIDLIICGHHDRNFFYNSFIGSISSKLIKKSKTPVLVVPFEA